MKKRIIAMFLVMITVLVSLAATFSEAYIPSETTTSKIRLTPLIMYSKEQLNVMMVDALADRGYADDMANAARKLGYKEDHDVILLAKKEWGQADRKYNLYKGQYETLIQKENNDKWSQREKEYPTATYIWKYLKGMGYNDYVCAGIMGNMMVEVGGQTLNLNHKARGTYYGICQWSKGYKEVWGANLSQQCDFLANSIRYEFNTFGSCYKKGFKYNNFIALTNEKQAALAFAKCYERCSSSTYSLRQKCATKALEYFTK